MSIVDLYNRFLGKKEINLSYAVLGDEGKTLIPLLYELTAEVITILPSQNPAWESETQSRFIIKGNSKQSLLGMNSPSIILIAEYIQNTIHFQFRIDTSTNWEFATSFPELKYTEFNRLSFSEKPWFVVTTRNIPEQNLTSGLNLVGNLKITNYAISLLELIPGIPELLPITGIIDNSDSYQLLAIKARVTDSTPALNLPGLLTFKFPKPVFAFYIYIYRNNKAVSISKRIESDVELTGGNEKNSVTIPLALELPTMVTGWQIMLQPDKVASLSNFIEFLSLLGSAGQFDLMSVFSDPSGKLAKVKDVLKRVIFKSFYIEIKGSLKEKPQFISFSFEVQSEGTLWSIVRDKLELADLKVFFKVSRAGTAFVTAGYIQGKVEIAENIVTNSLIPLPLGKGAWLFSSHHQIALPGFDTLSKFIEDSPVENLLPSSLKGMGGLELSEFSLVFDPSAISIKALEFSIMTGHPWNISGNDFVLDSLYFHFKIEKGSKGWGITGIIRGELLAGEIKLDAQVEKISPDSDWYFELYANSVPLPSLESLGSLIGGKKALEDALPESILTAQLYLNNPRIDFNLNKKKIEFFGFSLITDEIDFTDVKVIQAGIDVDINFSNQPAGKQIKIYGSLNIADIDFFIEGDYSNEEGWTLKGIAGAQRAIYIDRLISGLIKHFGIKADKNEQVLPSFISSLRIQNLGVSYNIKEKNFAFSCETKFIVESYAFDIVLNIRIYKEESGYKKSFDCKLLIDNYEFTMTFDSDKASTNFVGGYKSTDHNRTISIKSLVSRISGDLADIIPEVEIRLNNIIFAFVKTKGIQNVISKFLFAFEISAHADLSNIPLVGRILPDEHAIGIDSFRILVTSAMLLSDDVNIINNIIPQYAKLPMQSASQAKAGNTQVFGKGLNILAKIKYGSSSGGDMLTLPVSAKPEGKTPAATNNPSVKNNSNSSVKWFILQKAFGPVYFESIGISYKNQILRFLLNGSLNVAGLTITLIGAGFGTTLKNFDPHFRINGIDIEYRNSGLEIRGCFLEVFPAPADAAFKYAGAAVVKTANFSINAIGMYEQMKTGYPSMFMFANVSGAFGGPPFFFVTGFAGGFGYNSKLKIPEQNEVFEFPLVAGLTDQNAIGGINPTPDNVLRKLTGEGGKPWIIPQAGEVWLAAGIKFTTFKLINSNALLLAEFGKDFTLSLIGLSIARFPMEGPLVYAYIELQLRAVFAPDDGYICFSAVLSPNSFVIDKNCKVTGGFAFYLWFGDNEHAGDFVLTLGGYSPYFKVPAWYPKEPRVGINWSVCPNVSIIAEAYFALTPSAIMAGGKLDVRYQDGKLSAWLTAWADIIVWWNPFHFDANIGVSIGVSYTLDMLLCSIPINVEIGADLKLWGPETGGTVNIHMWFISFSIDFGSSFSNTIGEAQTWDQFKKVLPDTKDATKILLLKGLVPSQPSDDKNRGSQIAADPNADWVVSADNFQFSTCSSIPIYNLYVGNKTKTLYLTGDPVNIQPMKQKGLESFTQIYIEKEDGSEINLIDPDRKWSLSKKVSNVPTALWGSSSTKLVAGDQQLVKNQLIGLTITAPQAEAGYNPGYINIKDSFGYYTLSPGINPLKDNSHPSGPVATNSNQTTAKISKIMEDSVKSNRDLILKAITSLNLGRVTNEALSDLAANTGVLFVDEPLIILSNT